MIRCRAATISRLSDKVMNRKLISNYFDPSNNHFSLFFKQKKPNIFWFHAS